MKRILVVDDDEKVLSLVTAMLEGKDYIVTCARNGAQGLSAMYNEKPDLVLLDYGMPLINGIDFVKLAGLNRETADIPIIMLTGLSDKSKVIQLKLLGIRDYIVKPFDIKILEKKIQAATTPSAIERAIPEKPGYSKYILSHGITALAVGMSGEPWQWAAKEAALLCNVKQAKDSAAALDMAFSESVQLVMLTDTASPLPPLKFVDMVYEGCDNDNKCPHMVLCSGHGSQVPANKAIQSGFSGVIFLHKDKEKVIHALADILGVSPFFRYRIRKNSTPVLTFLPTALEIPTYVELEQYLEPIISAQRVKQTFLMNFAAVSMLGKRSVPLVQFVGATFAKANLKVRLSVPTSSFKEFSLVMNPPFLEIMDSSLEPE